MPGKPTPLVTIIIPSYNYGQFISQTLDSLLAQSYQNWECIIVDDGSTDNTSDIVARYQSRDRRFKGIKQANRGLSAARNVGLKKAAGEYIQFLDADDLLEKRKIEHHLEYLEDYPEVDIVYGSAKYFRTDNPLERRYSNREEDTPWMPEVSGSGKEVLHALLLNNIMVVSAPLIRREVIEEVGYFDTTIKVIQDWHYWIRCAARGKRFQFLEKEETLSLIRWHPDSLSQRGNNRNRIKMIEELFLMRRKIKKVIPDRDALIFNIELLVNHLAQLGVSEIEKDNWIKGTTYLLRAAYNSAGMTTKLRWCFAAAVAPLVPLDGLERLLSLPLRQSAREIYWRQLERSRKGRSAMRR
jgi:glycosyltransferase involved in cell wall biosynthesis